MMATVIEYHQFLIYSWMRDSIGCDAVPTNTISQCDYVNDDAGRQTSVTDPLTNTVYSDGTPTISLAYNRAGRQIEGKKNRWRSVAKGWSANWRA